MQETKIWSSLPILGPIISTIAAKRRYTNHENHCGIEGRNGALRVLSIRPGRASRGEARIPTSIDEGGVH